MLFESLSRKELILATSVVLPLILLWLSVVKSGNKNSFGRKIVDNLRASIQRGQQNHVVLNLLPDEKKRHLNTPSISTLTFYKKQFPIEDLRARLKEIVKINPFLKSRLVTIRDMDAIIDPTNSVNLAGVCAIYPNTLNDEDDSDFFRVVKDPSLNSQLPYEDLLRKVSKYDVALGRDAVDRNEPLFRVTLIEIEKGAHHCMMVSLCHTIADGFTFYKIYSMLDHRTPITPIVTERVHAFSSEMAKNLNFGTSLLELPFVLFGSLYNRFVGPPMQARVFAVNSEHVQEQKNKYTRNASTRSFTNSDAPTDKPVAIGTTHSPFLSTNDILTSWFFKFSKIEMGFMIANFRNRHSSLNDTHGGNYQGRILFLPPDMQQPEQIRASLQHFKPTSGATPTLTKVGRMNLALVTNWATFYTDVEFRGCEQVIHLPVIDLSQVALRQGMVVFQANKGVTGVILWTRGMSESLFEQERIIKPMV